MLKNKLLILSMTAALAACGGGGGSGGTTTFVASTACLNGDRPTSTTSQAAADALVPASCPVLSTAQVAALGFSVSTTGMGASMTTVLELANVPSGAVLQASTVTVTDPSGNSYRLDINPSPLSVTPTPSLPFGTTFTVSTGNLNFANAPSISLVGKTFTTRPAAQAPVAVIVLSTAPYFVGAAVSFNGGMSTDSDSTIGNYSWAFGDGSVGTGQNINHTYAAAGSYTVSLTVLDNSGLSHTRSDVINIVSGTSNDTGISAAQCYAAGSNTLVSCTSAGVIALNSKQDGMVGRDVTASTGTDGKLGFSFATVGSYAITDCVKDTVTGLVWEGKTATGARAGSNGYTNYDANYGTAVQIAAADNAANYVAAVNASALCGFTDWRLPVISELQSIVDYSVAQSVKIDTSWFPNTNLYAHHTVTPNANNSSQTWSVYFDEGGLDTDQRSQLFKVKLVRGAVVAPGTFTPNMAGDEILDNNTGLIWRRCVEGQVWSQGSCTGVATQYTHEQALQRASSQAANTGWRLPNIKEISSLVNRVTSTATIDVAAFPSSPASHFWSATPYVRSPGFAWYVDFSNGVVDSGLNNGRSSTYYLRLVR